MRTSSLPAVLEHLAAMPWALEEATLNRMAEVVVHHITGEGPSADELEAIAAAKAKPTKAPAKYEIKKATAIIPITGLIAKYSRMVNGLSAPRGTSIELLEAQLAEAVADERAKAIFLQIESPGGYVAGLPDFADAVYAAGQVKPVIAFADDMAMSGAYWIASQADRIYANQSAVLGSIGVYHLYVDTSRAADSAGLRFIIVRSGRHKGIGMPGIPITDENVRMLQAENDQYMDLFMSAIARGRRPRGLSAETLEEVADGRMLVGQQAADVGLVDGIMTLEQALASARPKTRKATAATASEPGPAAGKSEAGLAGEKIMTDEQAKAISPADVEKATAEASQGERDRCTAVTKYLAGWPTLAEAAVADSECDEAKAAQMLVPALQERVATLQEELTAAEAKLEKVAEGGLAPLVLVPSDEELEKDDKGTEGDAGTAEHFEAAVKEFEAAGDSKSRALRNATVKFPKSFAAWTKSNQPK